MKTQKTAAACNSVKMISNLPYSHGHSFCSLEAYLDHLQQYARTIGQPWWRQIGPDVYEHVTPRIDLRAETASRAELMKRFGFSK